MDPITLPNERKPIIVIHPRHKGGPASWRVKHAVGVILVTALIALLISYSFAPSGQAATFINRMV